MAFIQPCFIRENTIRLRNELEKLGYKPFGSVKYEWDTGYGLSTDNRLGEFESFDDNGLENILKCCSPDYEDSIDCGTNENLFLSIAALRDDSDKEQWFITYKSSHPYMSYAAILCREDKWEDEYIKETQQHCFIDTKPEDYHKANVKEIIRIYKEFDEELKDLYED